LDIILAVGNLHRRDGRCYFYKPMIHFCSLYELHSKL
jgi:hypothetical protein